MDAIFSGELANIQIWIQGILLHMIANILKTFETPLPLENISYFMLNADIMFVVAQIRKFIDSLGPEAGPERMRHSASELGGDHDELMPHIAEDILGPHSEEFFRKITEDPEYMRLTLA